MNEKRLKEIKLLIEAHERYHIKDPITQELILEIERLRAGLEEYARMGKYNKFYIATDSGGCYYDISEKAIAILKGE